MSVAAQTLRPPSKTLMLLEGRRAFHELGAFFGALPLLSLAPVGDGHPVLVLPGLVASDVSTRPLRTFLKTRGYAVCGWRLGRNLGLRDGVQDAMVELVHELNDSHGRTVSAWALMQSLEVSSQELDIRSAATQMLKDMGHPFGKGEPVYDITFENVQAGLRTDYLFRLANHHGGIVIGTGDLSELALGWCTYGVGDQMAHYNVNSGVLGHLVRAI